MARLHGRVRSAGPRDRAVAACACCEHLGVTFGVLRKEKCTGDPVRRLGNDLLFSATGGGQHRAAEGREGDQDGFHLPALRAHHRRGLEGIRRGVPDRTSQRIAGAPCARKLPQRTDGRESVVYHDPCYLGRYRGVYDEPREVIGALVTCRSAARARAIVLLRRRRRSDVPGRRKGQARERGARRRTGGDRSGGGGHGLPVLPDDVPRCVRDHLRRRRRSCWTSPKSRRHRSSPRRRQGWYNSELARQRPSRERALPSRQRDLQRARSSIGRASDS